MSSMEGLASAAIWLIEQEGLERRALRNHRIWVWFWRLLLTTVVLVGWQVAADRRWIDPFFSSSPMQVLHYYEGALPSAAFWDEVWVTVFESLVSFLAGSVTAIAAGFLLAQSRIARDAAGPFLTIMNSMPRVALAPLLIIWFGLGIGSKIAVGFSLTFFVVLNGTLVGVDSVDRDHSLLSRQLGLSRAELFRKIVLPSSIVSIFASLNLGLVYGFLGVVVTEMLASSKGLGHLIQQNAGVLRTDGVLGIVAFLAILVAALVSGLDVIERRLLRWQSQRD